MLRIRLQSSRNVPKWKPSGNYRSFKTTNRSLQGNRLILPPLECFKVEKLPNGVMEIIMNKPDKLNTMNEQFFQEIGVAFEHAYKNADVRSVILWSEGKMFSAGLDLKGAAKELSPGSDESHLKQSLRIYRIARSWQSILASIRSCTKPVIAAIHGQCIGGAVDLATWCDIRIATKDASFSIKETQMGMVADLGTLQRIGKLTSSGFAREMTFTGGAFDAQRALHFGFVNQVYDSKEAMLLGARELAKKIAENSAVAVQGSKVALNYAEDHTLEDSLNQVALWNSAFLQSEDLNEAISSFIQKRQPTWKEKF